MRASARPCAQHARAARAREAHAAILAGVHRAQADALLIEAGAKVRLADEYDAAQARGEVRTRRDNQHVPDRNKPRVADLGLSRKDIHDARKVRDAEAADPGAAARMLGAMVKSLEEPSRAALRRSTLAAIEEARRAIILDVEPEAASAGAGPRD